MDDTTWILFGTAASIGLVHTLVGVDHSLPFVVLARSERWPLGRLWAITAICGLAHILGSVIIGSVGIGLGVALGELAGVETLRGAMAARLLIGFGLAYAVWGMVRGVRAEQHAHAHAHTDGTVHVHVHDHHDAHLHVHGRPQRTLTLLGLIVVFVLGPCEALIPLLLAPAFERSWVEVLGVILVFGTTTIGTMLVLVTLGHAALAWTRSEGVSRRWERHVHAFAGLAIAASGVAIELLGT